MSLLRYFINSITVIVIVIVTFMTNNQRIRNKVFCSCRWRFCIAILEKENFLIKKLEKEIRNFLDLKVIRSEILYDETSLNFLSECRSGSAECKLYIKITPYATDVFYHLMVESDGILIKKQYMVLLPQCFEHIP